MNDSGYEQRCYTIMYAEIIFAQMRFAIIMIVYKSSTA